jgi:hypothetical protein
MTEDLELYEAQGDRQRPDSESESEKTQTLYRF